MISKEQKQWILDQLEPTITKMAYDLTDATGNIRQKVEVKTSKENTELRDFLTDIVQCFDVFEDEVKKLCK